MNPRTKKLLQRLQVFEYWLVAKLVMFILRLLRLFPAPAMLDFAGRVGRRLGPLTGRHRIALDNLAQAMPELDADQRQAIALDMWDNMGRLAVEFIYLDRLADQVAQGLDSGNFAFHGAENFFRIRDERRPHIFFTAHLGNFELLPVAAARHGMQLTALFRPPNNPFLAREIAKIRNLSTAGMVPSRKGASFTLARILGDGGNVGILVDQKFPKGVRTTFFGRSCGTNPLVAKLARHFDCDIYPCRCIRRPGNRFELEFMDRIELPLDSSGQLDVAATTQLLNDIVERWVRETPGQWTWFHRRWDL